MTDANVRVQEQDGSLVVTLQRLDKANALNAAMMRTLGEALARPAGLRILRSASPRLFCAGADIAEFVAGADALAGQEHALIGMIEGIAASRAPLIAVARGKASGAGVVLLALADVVLAADDLEIACPEIRFGMYPIIVEAVLQSRVSPALAAHLCLGNRLDARQAREAGMATEVLPAARFEAEAQERLAFYRERAQALATLRASRLAREPAEELCARVRRVAPLMARNFSSAGVRERILGYLAGLKGGDAGVDKAASRL